LRSERGGPGEGNSFWGIPTAMAVGPQYKLFKEDMRPAFGKKKEKNEAAQRPVPDACHIKKVCEKKG